MLRGHTRALFGLALLTAALLVAANARAGDDDEHPAYMIYIDPETGRYTTEDPLTDAPAEETTAPVRRAAPETDRAKVPFNWLPVAAGAAAAVALLAFAGRHRFLHRRPPQRVTEEV